jgi:hypothetical protein
LASKPAEEKRVGFCKCGHVFFSRANGGFIIDEEARQYEQISATEYRYTAFRKAEAKKDGIKKFDGRFAWSSNSRQARILPSAEGQSIVDISDDGIWTVFSVMLERPYKNGEEIRTGYIISSLIDSDGLARPFLSVTTRHKIKTLRLEVLLPEDDRVSDDTIRGAVIDTNVNVVGEFAVDSFFDENTKKQHLRAAIKYPRKGYRYRITWGYEA